MRNIKLIIEYDGAAYNGWQRQADVLTIQQVMEDALSRIVNDRAVLIASSRTDTGVHALNQVANFRTASQLPLRNLHMGVNSLLPPDIVVKEMSEVPWEFHSRYHARSKIYHYRIFNGPVRTALAQGHLLVCPSPARPRGHETGGSCTFWAPMTSIPSVRPSARWRTG